MTKASSKREKEVGTSIRFMKNFLSFLSEAKAPEKVVVSFGRFNPPSRGHEKLADRIIAEAKKRGAVPILFASQSQDPKKNPLQWKDKIKLLKKAFPGLTVSTDKSLRNLFQIAVDLSDNGTKEFTLVVGSDRVDDFRKSLGKFVKSGNKSLDLQFDKFEVVSAGERDPDAQDVTGISASKLRQAVISGDMKLFARGLPGRLVKDAEKIFNLVKRA